MPAPAAMKDVCPSTEASEAESKTGFRFCATEAGEPAKSSAALSVDTLTAFPGTGSGRREPLFVPDDAGFSKEHFVIPSYYADCVERILIPQGLIHDRIERLAVDILQTYAEAELHVVCILKGSRGFFNVLIQFFNNRAIYVGSPRSHPPYLEHYVRIKSYSGTESQGDIKVISEDLSGLRGKHVLIVEDIIDTGVTLTRFCEWLRETVAPRTIAVATLLEKRVPRACEFRGDFVGFSVPNAFLVGFSLDYNEMFRDLGPIAVISETGIKRYALPNAAASDSSTEPAASL